MNLDVFLYYCYQDQNNSSIEKIIVQKFSCNMANNISSVHQKSLMKTKQNFTSIVALEQM